MISTSKDYMLPEHCRGIFVNAANRLQGNNSAGKKLLDVAGNGRFVRNVVELAIEEHSDHMRDLNLSALSDEELLTLTPRDIAAGMRKELTKYFGQAAPEIYIPAGEHDPSYSNGEVS
ncbi:hypothetical protein [Mycolicibacterium llatzerense]|uniref:hypothetical protein n=1 Tax=Mycolicibacterium llatzerense TaxID=280871 RepID=UPI0008DCDA94|nr:hypothetical protein [Mycolicibacterium llatzerense]